MRCQGQQYHSAHPLKFKFHSLVYEIECAERAKNGNNVIYQEVGKGHSNLPEAKFSVLTKFRAKDTNLYQKHYQASTNLGPIQSNVTWLHKVKGPQYHWIVNLYSRLGLPVLSGIREMVSNNCIQNTVYFTWKFYCFRVRGQLEDCQCFYFNYKHDEKLDTWTQ